MRLRGRRGFTLIELMITIMIFGLLATAGTPLLAGAMERARVSEATAAMGSIRRAMRMYYVEHGTYRNPNFLCDRKVTFGGILPLTDGDLEGRYFSSDCYTFEKAKRRTFRIKCSGAESTAPAGREVAEIVMFINQHGDIWYSLSAEDGDPLQVLAVATRD